MIKPATPLGIITSKSFANQHLGIVEDIVRVIDVDGFSECEVSGRNLEERLARAEYIKTACNLFPELVAQLEDYQRVAISEGWKTRQNELSDLLKRAKGER